MSRRTVVLLLLAALALISVGVGTLHRQRDEAPDISGEQAIMASDMIVQLEIRNGSGVAGLAADLSLSLGKVGATAALLANAPHDHFPRSLLINRKLDDDRAAALARDLGGLPLLLELDPASATDAVLVLGADHHRIREALSESSGRH